MKNSKYLPPASGIERYLKAPWPLPGNHIISEITACCLSLSFLVFLSSDKAGAKSKTETNNTLNKYTEQYTETQNTEAVGEQSETLDLFSRALYLTPV